MDEEVSVMGEYESDTGFSSQASSDEVIENMEEIGLKRKLSESENETEKRCGKKLRKLRRENELKKLHKPPTAEELNRLKETQNLFHSNLFRLQIEEMLKEIQVKEKNKIEFEAWYEKFSNSLLKLNDSGKKYNLMDQSWLMELNVKIPFPQLPNAGNGTYQFKKPSQLSIIGSFSTSVLIGPKILVDVLVEIPSEFFQRDDYLNCRYHQKKALYICELVYHIQQFKNLVDKVVFVNEEIDCLRPKVEITPVGKFSKHISVLLHFAAEKGTFKLNRFSPSKSNLRKKWFFKEKELEKDFIPTPFYNSTILADLLIEDNMKFLKNSLLMHNNIKDGIILLKVWLKQRELYNSIGGFNGFILAMLVCYLLQIKKINILMSSYQVFRNVCNYLVGCDWTANGITLCGITDDANLPTMSEFHLHHKVVFTDFSGYHNLCFAMSPYTFYKVQREAQFALACLNNANINSFQSLFITKVPFYQHFDHVVVINNEDLLQNISVIHCSKEEQLNQCSVVSFLVRESVLSLLSKGFGNRITHICSRLPLTNRWKVNKKFKPSLTLTIGFNLDPNNYFSVIDKAQEFETDAFREFWGTKSELRRFQDGTITEAVVWSGRTLAEKRLLCREILTYLLQTKFGFDSRDFHYLANQMDCYIGRDLEEASLKVLEASDQLMKQLRDLNNLPLDIVSTQGVSSVFRYTDAFPPVPQIQSKISHKRTSVNHAVIIEELNSCPPWISPIEIIVKMAQSSKWPQDLEAIKRIRAAFNIKISDSLKSQYGVACEAFQDRVEAIKNGFVFRIYIVHPNEIALLKRVVDSDGLVKYKDTDKSSDLERKTVYLPKITSALHGIYQENSSFGPACCLVKRWVSAHLLDDYHISNECLELLVASLYLRPEPHEPPCQPQVAFFRFHHMMATTNWNTECIILNINGELTRSEIIEIESEFNTNRATLPAIFIATPYERKKSVFTKDSPTPLILLRLIELCANAMQLIENQIYSKILFNKNILFQPCFDSYDVLIKIDDTFNPKKRIFHSKLAEDINEFRQNIPITGFDPVNLYLQELRNNYSDFALFFHDAFGGSVISLIWKPTALEFQDFKVSSLPGRIYNEKTKKMELNKDAIIEDFWHLGKNLVRQIDVKVDGVFHEVFKVGVSRS